MPEFHMIFARKTPFFRILGAMAQFPALYLRVSGLDPSNQLRDHGGHRSTGAIVLNKLFTRLFALLYSISLDE